MQIQGNDPFERHLTNPAMTNPNTTNQLNHARQLEESGQFDAALAAYHQAHAEEDVARLMFKAGRPDDAGHYLLATLNLHVVHGQIDPRALNTLKPEARPRLLRAALCFARGKQTDLGIDLMVTLGEIPRAVELLNKLGHTNRAELLEASFNSRSHPSDPSGRSPANTTPSAPRIPIALRRLESDGNYKLALESYLQHRLPAEAARMAQKLGQPLRAAQLYYEGARPYESALCFLQAGELHKAMEQFCRVPRDDAHYRDAASRAIVLANQLDHLDFALENFLSSFLDSPPTSDNECNAFYEIARLYLRHDFLDNARDCLTLLLKAAPAYRDAQYQLQQIGGPITARTENSNRIDHQQNKPISHPGFDPTSRSSSSEFELPDLPDLPDLPPLPGPPATQRHAHSNDARPPISDHSLGIEKSYASRPKLETAASRSQPSTSDTALTAADDPSSTPSLFKGITEGSVLANRYRLLKKLGEGGMASVYKAEDLDLGELVAIKVFPQTNTDESLIARFKQELSLSRRLTHLNIIRLHDIGHFLGYRFISMELLEGADLSNYLRKPVRFELGLNWLIQACHGLQAAHERGVIHRDVKPQNIFICQDGTVKIMDFGIAKQLEGQGVTVGNVVAGTPDYMAPEQISGFSKVSHSADIYAIGITAYRMFTGKLPFTHPELMPLLMKHLSEPPQPPRELNPSIPPQLEHVILKLIEKKPEQRYESCAAAADAFEEVLKSLPL